MIFYFDFANYFKMVGLAAREKKLLARTYYLVVLLLWVPLVSSFHAVCFFLDGIFFPKMLRTRVKAPIFMVGHARSGTTLTHRLLMQDEGRFSAFMLYELYFPSLIQKKCIRSIASIDRGVLGGFLEKRVKAWEARRYRSDAHAMGLTIPEEDDIVLYYSMASGFWITKMPYMGELDFYHLNDRPKEERTRLFDFYRDCVRRQLYLNGPEKTHLSKNPLYSGRVASILEAFPDARIIVNLRNPNETIPSLLKLMSGAYRVLGWDPEKQAETFRVLVDISTHTYMHPLEALEANPGVGRALVEYEDLVADPAGAIERIYRDLEIPMSAEFEARLREASPRSTKHETAHRYSLEEFGLDADEIERSLGPLFERFGWKRHERRGAMPDGSDRDPLPHGVRP